MSAIETMSSEGLAHHRPLLSLAGRALGSLWTYYRERRQLRRTRLHLLELSDAELWDIGITREAADREAARSLLACYLNNAR